MGVLHGQHEFQRNTYWVRVPRTTNVEGNKEERARRTEGRSLRGKIERNLKGARLLFPTAHQPVKNLYPAKDFFPLNSI